MELCNTFFSFSSAVSSLCCFVFSCSAIFPPQKSALEIDFSFKMPSIMARCYPLPSHIFHYTNSSSYSLLTHGENLFFVCTFVLTPPQFSVFFTEHFPLDTSTHNNRAKSWPSFSRFFPMKISLSSFDMFSTSSVVLFF